MPNKVIIIDDDESSRFLYRYYFRDVPEAQIIAEFESAEQALLQIPQLMPDVAIVDYSLPGMSGLQFALRVNQFRKMKILLASSLPRDYFTSEQQRPPNVEVVQKDWSKPAVEKMIAFCK
jgi:DNA-binding NarL/FixJ family response regulator